MNVVILLYKTIPSFVKLPVQPRLIGPEEVSAKKNYCLECDLSPGFRLYVLSQDPGQNYCRVYSLLLAGKILT